MHILKQLLENSLSPIGLLILSFATAWCLALFERNRRLKNCLLMAAAFLYLVFIISPLAEIVMAPLERSYAPLLKLEASTQVQTIVVLSSYGEEHFSTPITSNISEDTLYRIVEGIRLYRQIPAAKLLMSGGTLREGDPPISRLMAEFAGAEGVPQEDLLTEENSQDTYENLLEVQKMLGSKPFVLVTSAYHLPRAMAIARKLHMHAIAVPAQIYTLQHFPPHMSWSAWSERVAQSFLRPSLRRLFILQRAYHEYVGYGWYKLQGRI
jgi:uncharacterized SAM-binding protein YcdF (DUF218 family)